jgi:hypothetical protein
MKSVITLIAIFFTFSCCTASWSKNDDTVPTQNNGTGTNNPSTSKMKITIGTTVFIATLYENPSATAFKAMFPLTINMNSITTKNITISPVVCLPMLLWVATSKKVI